MLRHGSARRATTGSILKYPEGKDIDLTLEDGEEDEEEHHGVKNNKNNSKDNNSKGKVTATSNNSEGPTKIVHDPGFFERDEATSPTPDSDEDDASDRSSPTPVDEQAVDNSLNGENDKEVKPLDATPPSPNTINNSIKLAPENDICLAEEITEPPRSPQKSPTTTKNSNNNFGASPSRRKKGQKRGESDGALGAVVEEISEPSPMSRSSRSSGRKSNSPMSPKWKEQQPSPTTSDLFRSLRPISMVARPPGAGSLSATASSFFIAASPRQNPTSPAPDSTGDEEASPNFSRTSIAGRSIPPLLRRYSQDFKDVFTLNTARMKERKTLEAAVAKFNTKPSSAIDYLVNLNIIRRTPEDVAQFIKKCNNELSKKRVGDFVGSADPFGQQVLRLLLHEYDFTGMTLDQALRVSSGITMVLFVIAQGYER